MTARRAYRLRAETADLVDATPGSQRGIETPVVWWNRQPRPRPLARFAVLVANVNYRLIESELADRSLMLGITDPDMNIRIGVAPQGKRFGEHLGRPAVAVRLYSQLGLGFIGVVGSLHARRLETVGLAPQPSDNTEYSTVEGMTEQQLFIKFGDTIPIVDPPLEPLVV